MQLESSLAFLNFDLSAATDSALIPATGLKSLPERQVNVKGFVAEVVVITSNNQGSYAGNYSHTTYFVKVRSTHQLFHHASPIDEIKIFVKVYPQKLEDFQKLVALGSLIEFLNVKQYFSAELNFVFRVEFRPNHVIYSEGEEMEPHANFRKRLAIFQLKEIMVPTILADLNPRVVIRRCVKVAHYSSVNSRYRDSYHDRCSFTVQNLSQQIEFLHL